jgi:hypothetical protein
VRFVPTVFHAVTDYLVAIALILMPFALGWSGLSRTLIVAIGVTGLLVSFLTDYELGAYRLLRIRFHLLFDAVFGIVMLLLASLMDIPQAHRWPLYVIGIFALLMSLVTKIRAQGTAV